MHILIFNILVLLLFPSCFRKYADAHTVSCKTSEDCASHANEHTLCKKGKCISGSPKVHPKVDSKLPSKVDSKIDSKAHPIPVNSPQKTRLAELENPNIRIIWGNSPATQATISITSDSLKSDTIANNTANNTALLLFGNNSLSKTKLEYTQKIKPTHLGNYESTRTHFYSHFKLENLTPSTRYYFRIKTPSALTKEYYFITAPDDDRPFKLLYGGDSRSDSKMRQQVNLLIKKLLQDDPSILAFVHGGDYNMSANRWSQWEEWLEDHELTTADDGRILPIIPTRGNHEGNGISYNQSFGFPAGMKKNYWTAKIGKLLWITLDSNISHAGLQKEFLERSLIKGQKYRWIVPSYHRPAYPAVKTPGAAFTQWVPLFEKYNVDFVAESDGHVLKRTLPIRDGQHQKDGIVYIGEGGLGVPQRRPDTTRWYLKSPGMAISAHHIQRLSFSPKEAKYEAITLDGKIADTYHFYPRNRQHTSSKENSKENSKAVKENSKAVKGNSKAATK